MITRRQFLQASLSVALAPLVTRVAWAQTVQVRPSWQVFCASPAYSSLLNAIASMKANKNSADPASWSYWSAVHQQLCPHGLPYFLAWHRGFLKSFETQLRNVSADPTLVLPYWDYYTDPTVPAEFLDNTSPLWRNNRTGDNVAEALSLDPFADIIIRFPRGKPDAFEPLLEARPHNPVHNLVGGIMNTMASPLDPLFWLHHANIDRLWAAWVAAGNGRRMPATTNSYWAGDFSYGAALPTLPRRKTYATTRLGYVYDNLVLPGSLPGATYPAAIGAFALQTPATPTAVQTVTAGQGQPLVLDERSIRVEVLLDPASRGQIRSLLLQPASAAPANDAIRVVLDDVKLTALGQKGGYFYRVYINLPAQADLPASGRKLLLGMVGPFEIAAARMRTQMGGGQMGHHKAMAATPVQLVFPATEAMRADWPDNLDTLSVSFVRANGSSQPRRGAVISIGALRVETSASSLP